MNIVEVAVGDLHPYANNQRLNDVAIKYVKESIEKFGFKVPLGRENKGGEGYPLQEVGKVP